MKRGTLDFAPGNTRPALDTPRKNGDNEQDMKGVVRMKRFLCGFLCLCFLWTGISLAFAEDDEENPSLIDELIDEENEEIEQTGSSTGRVTGKVYPTPTAEDFDLDSPAVYTCKLGPDRPIFRIMDPT